MDRFLLAILWGLLSAGLGIGEAAVAGTFFMLPFAVGAAVAAVASLAGLGVIVSILTFAVASGAAFFLVKPLADKLDIDLPEPMGFGANRLVGHEATVVRAIGTGEKVGQVKVGGETWTAVTRGGESLAAGAAVRILEVKGNRVVVEADLVKESYKELPS